MATPTASSSNSRWIGDSHLSDSATLNRVPTPMNVCIIGTGYVGLTTGVCLAYLGHQVTCIDSDAHKIEMLCAGQIPIYEPFLAELLAEARANIRFKTDYAEGVPNAEVIFIAVGTPPSPSGSPDLKYLRSAAQGIGEHFDGQFRD